MDVDLAERLERFIVAEEVRDTVARYCRTIDESRSLDDLEALFAPEAVLRNPTEYRGRDRILEYYKGFFDSGVGFSRHHVVNDSVVALDERRARFSAYFLVLMERDGRSLVALGNYDDTLERGDGGWRFAEKRNDVLRIVAIGDASA